MSLDKFSCKNFISHIIGPRTLALVSHWLCLVHNDRVMCRCYLLHYAMSYLNNGPLSIRVKMSHTYHGNFSYQPFDVDSCVMYRDTTSSWSYLFSFKDNNEPEVMSLCVIDIDFDWTGKENLVAFNSGILPTEYEQVMQEYVTELEEYAYWIMWSGNKGFHIYIVEPLLVFEYRKLSQDEVVGVWKKLLPGLSPTAISYLDGAPFSNRCGIRQWNCAHPVTHNLPRLYKTNQTRPIDEFPAMLEKVLRTTKPISLGYTHNDSLIETVASFSINADGIYGVIDAYVTGLKVRLGNQQRTGTKVIYDGMVYCPLVERNHKHVKACWFITGDAASYCCLSPGCRQKTIHLRCKKPNILTTVPAALRQRAKGITTIDSQYVSKDLLHTTMQTEPRVLLLSPMGSGKTTAVKEVIVRLLQVNPLARIIFLTTRVIQSIYFAKYFRDLGFVSYRDVVGSLVHVTRLVCTLHSIPRIRDTNGIPMPVDLFIVDEFASVITTHLGPSVSSGRYTFRGINDTFTFLMYTSRKVIMMDGVPSKIMYHYLSLTKIIHTTHIIENVLLGDNRTYKVYLSMYHYLNTIKQLLKTDDVPNAVFISNSKNCLRATYYSLIDMFPDIDKKDIITLWSECEEDNRNTLEYPDISWKKCRFLLYNTYVGPGISFDAKDHFKYIFVECKPHTGGTPIDAYQLSFRIRNPISRDIRMYIHGVNGTEQSILIDAVIDDVREHVLSLCDFQNEQTTNKYSLNNVVIDGQVMNLRSIPSIDGMKRLLELAVSKQLQLQPENDLYVRLFALYTQNKTITSTPFGFLKTMRWLIESNGGQFMVIDSDCTDIAKRTKNNDVAANVLVQLQKKRTVGNVTFDVNDTITTEDERLRISRFVDYSVKEPLHAYHHMLLCEINGQEGAYWDLHRKISSGQAAWVHQLNTRPIIRSLRTMLNRRGITLRTNLSMSDEYAYTPCSPDELSGWVRIATMVHNMRRLHSGINPKPPPDEHASIRRVLPYIKNTFKLIGITITSGRTATRTRPDGTKGKHSMLIISDIHCRLRTALAGIHPDTFEVVGPKKALSVVLPDLIE